MRHFSTTYPIAIVYLSHTVGTVRRPFTPIRTLFATHYSHSRRIVFTAIRTLFLAQLQRIQTETQLFAHLFANSRTYSQYQHSIRNSRSIFSPGLHYNYSQLVVVRAVHTPFALLSHTKFPHVYSHHFTPRSHYLRNGARGGEPIRTHSRSIQAQLTRTRAHL